jgi:hypothetical protein
MNFADTKSQGLYSKLPQLKPKSRPDGAKARAKAMDGTPEERAEYVERVMLSVQSYTQCHDLADDLIQRTGVLRFPGGMLVVGEGGEGKTFLAEKIAERYPASDELIGFSKPVLVVSLADSPSEKEFFSRMYAAIGQTKIPQQHVEQNGAIKTLARALNTCGVRLIFFDEAQTLWVMTASRRSKGRVAGPIGEKIKALYDESGIAIIFLANPSLEEMFDLDKQTFTRWSLRQRLKSPDFGPDYIGRLNAWDEALPMAIPSGLGKEHIAKHIHEFTKANFRLDRMFFANCVRTAASEGLSCLTPAVLNKGLYLTFGTSDSPFKKGG